MHILRHPWCERVTGDTRGWCHRNFGTWRRNCAHCDLRTEAEETVGIELIIQLNTSYGGYLTDKTNVFIGVRMKKRAVREALKRPVNMAARHMTDIWLVF